MACACAGIVIACVTITGLRIVFTHFAILSAITPPVALAVFAAAGLAKANMWTSGFAAMRAVAPAYIVPLMFVYEPLLLMVVDDWATQWYQVRLAATSAVVGVIFLAASLHGWLLTLLACGSAHRSTLTPGRDAA